MAYYYDKPKRLHSLSVRLKNFAKEPNTYTEHVDKVIIMENLEYNLALFIAKLILLSQYKIPDQSQLERVIEKYNALNGTNLTIKDFEDRFWIRKINGQIVIPSNVRFIRSQNVFTTEDSGYHLLQCLNDFLEEFQDNLPLISTVQLNSILKEWSAHIDITFLIGKSIIKETSNSKVYHLNGGEYTRYLRNEIAANLWNLITKSTSNIANFRKFISVLIKFEIWPDKLGDFLTHNSINELKRLILVMLNEEEDLLDNGNEIKKAYIDSPSYAHITLTNPVPNIFLNSKNAIDLIKEIDYLHHGVNGIFEHQEARSTYNLLLKLLLENDFDTNNPYSNVRNLLKEIKYPYLVYHTYSKIQRAYPEIIPFLLLDDLLIPMSFKLVSTISIRPDLMTEQENNIVKYEEGNELTNKFWLEEFEYILNLFNNRARETYPELAERVADILLDLSKDVFTFNSNNLNEASVKHQIVRKRYDIALSMLKEKRLSNSTYNNFDIVRPRLYPFIISELYNRLSEPSSLLEKNEFIQIPFYKVDVLVELLRICGTPLLNTETTTQTVAEIEKIKQQICMLIIEKILFFFTAIDIDVLSPYGFENRKVKRGVKSFGLEIVDWGYLFAHIEKYNLFNSFNEKINRTLIFDSTAPEGIYLEGNRDQAEKIVVYIRILLFAHLHINRQKTKLHISPSDEVKAINIIEDLIKNYTLQFSDNDLEKNKIDVFDEKFYWFNHDIYSQSLASLLCQVVNSFKTIEQDGFVRLFFKKSFNIGRMLTALNKLDSKSARQIIADRISSLDIPGLIKNMTIAELEEALIEAINSDTQFDKADVLIERIEQYLERSKLNTDQSKDFLFKIKLLLAFKQKNAEMLSKVEIPVYPHQVQKTKSEDAHRKLFYTALFQLYNENKYESAVSILENLMTHEPKNIDFAFHLYRAKTLKAIHHE